MRRQFLVRCSAALAVPLLTAAAAAGPFDPWTQPARYQFTYRVDLAQIEAEPGDRVRIWIPEPAETEDQHVVSLAIDSPVTASERRDALGNRILSAAWIGRAPAGALAVRAVVERRVSHGIARAKVAGGSPDDPARHLAPTRRIPLDGVIAQIGVAESAGKESDAAKIRAFYDYVVSHMRYAKDGDGWGHGDAIWACTAKYGNCTDFHSLFLGLARSQGIAARFTIGFPIAASATGGDIPGYHCWAEAWDRARGWVPVDASEAWKAKRFDDYFGTLPSDRIEITTGRDLVLAPPQEGPPLNFFVPSAMGSRSRA
jgi:transglutaminase-like putative cysteine protease